MIQILGLLLLCSGAAAEILCTKVPGKLKQVDAGAGQVYGVNDDDNIYQWVNNNWKEISGKLIHVTVGPAGVWGANRVNNVYHLQDNNWVPITVAGVSRSSRVVFELLLGPDESLPPVAGGVEAAVQSDATGDVQKAAGSGLLKQIDAGGEKFLSGANALDWIYCLNQDQTVSRDTYLPYIPIEGRLKYYSCGPYGCWGVNSHNNIYYRYGVEPTACQGTQWKQIEGSLIMVEVGTDGSVYGANYQGDVYRREGISASNPIGTSWTRLDLFGSYQHVSYDRGTLWLIAQNGDIHKCYVNGCAA